MEYSEFLKLKQFSEISAGFVPDLSKYQLKDFQQDIVKWACMKGRAAVFADTGLGKTFMQLAWADQVKSNTKGKVLVLAPLAVSEQTIKEGEKFGIKVCKWGNQTESGVYITNYEQLKNVDAGLFDGVVLDESSILKGFQGKMRKMITESFKNTPYRLSCTATPSPNDLMEFGTQSEFLGVMTHSEMLAMFFINDTGDTSKWRLKGHGRAKFWEWLSTWSVVIRSPSDYGYDSTGYDLPELVIHDHVIDSGKLDGLLPWIAQSLSERISARRDTIEQRVDKAAEIANSIDGQCLIWCNLNGESERLTSDIDGAVEVAGATKPEIKTDRLLGFSSGDVQKLVTKPKIAGFGMNWQSCNHIIFTGLSDSFEQYYQAVRRCWRFGQKKQVHVHIVSADSEGAVVANIKAKEQQHNRIAKEMIACVKDFTMQQIKETTNQKIEYKPTVKMEIPKWM